MEKSLRIGFVISFILSGVISVLSGVLSVNDDLVYIGMGLLVLAFVWGMLFVFPKSPIRKWCWSVSDKLSIAIVYYGGLPPGGNRSYLTVYGELRALSPIKVEKMIISIRRKQIISWDWRPHVVTGDEEGYIDFKRPEWLADGNYDARLIACTPYGYSKSEKFAIRVRD